MDQAREAAQVVTEFFQGNPFGTHVGKMIEQATDETLSSENWALNMDICDAVNTLADGPKDAIRAIRKRLQTNMGKNNKVVLYTLTVLETAVKNCDMRFLLFVAQKEFCQELVKLIGSKYDPPQVVQEKVLGLIQAWADAFRNQPDLRGVCEIFDELKAKGVDFPMTDMDSMVPIITPKKIIVEQMHTAPPTPISSSTVLQGHIRLEEQQLGKLRSELDVVNGNMKVLREMLAELHPGKEDPDDLHLLQDLNKTCRQMQQRLVALLQRIANEEVTSELLMINDEMNNVFSKYDRYWQNRTGATEKPSTENGAAKSLIDFDSNHPNISPVPNASYVHALHADELNVGLGTAAQQKGTRQPVVSDVSNEHDVTHVEAWLKNPTSSTTETATTSHRENNPSNQTTPSSPQNKEETEQQMFAL